MRILLSNLGKRFNRQWIFRGINLELQDSDRYVILGRNGSGKSTLLQTIAGYRMPSEGSVQYIKVHEYHNANTQYSFISFAAPYLELIEDFDIMEMLRFHFRLKPLAADMTPEAIISMMQLRNLMGKPVKQYSSGMKQRLRLALAFFADTPVLLLDEPCSNLDSSGIEWYRTLLENYSRNRLVIICSNHQEHEFHPCNNLIDISAFK